MPSNTAAWITESKGKPLVVKEAPYTSPGPNEVLVKNGAVSINPVDWKIQEYGFMMEKFPNILGCDVAGEIAEVGSGVENFKVGQRVLGHSAALMTQNSAEAGFQAYTIIKTALLSAIPSSLSYTSAVVLPLGLSTAAAGLFEKDKLGLNLPTTSPSPTGTAVLVWGGSSSVGSCAIQLAKAAGYTVYATASKHNHDYCKSLGAEEVFDYNSSDVVGDVTKALQGRELAGIYDSISSENTVKASIAISEALPGSKKVASTLPGTDALSTADVKVLPVFAITIMYNEVGPAVYGKYVPEALEKGLLLAKPDPIVVGKGLDKVQEALDKSHAGVSAGKVVVEL